MKKQKESYELPNGKRLIRHPDNEARTLIIKGDALEYDIEKVKFTGSGTMVAKMEAKIISR